MRFDKGLKILGHADQDGNTASFSLTASTRNLLIDTITAWSIGSNATVTVQASGTTVWTSRCGSACIPMVWNGLAIENEGAGTLSCLVAGATSACISAIGLIRQI